MAALFTDDADFVNVVGLWWTNRSQIRDNHAYGFRHMIPDTARTLDRVTFRMLGADVAVVHASWTMGGEITPAGQRPAPGAESSASPQSGNQTDGGWP